MLFFDNPEKPARTSGLETFVARAIALFRSSDDRATIGRLTVELEKQRCIVEEQATALAHSRKIFDRSSAAARIGVWECSLPDNSLKWTDVVYDIFELPRGAALERNQTVSFYTEESMRELGIKRSKAIAERGGFGMDAEIITAKGNRRWMRITATVESENGVPVRIFGMKQDITEEKNMQDQTRYLANFDVMTGLANRANFQQNFATFCDDPQGPGMHAALILVDLDGFKSVNDTHGHSAGDACLKEAADRLRAICDSAELVARIGGDEFAILFRTYAGPDMITHIARATIRDLRRPVAYDDLQLQIGASAGIALVDGSSSSELFRRADVALYAAKAAGRNTFRLFEHDKAVAACFDAPLTQKAV